VLQNVDNEFLTVNNQVGTFRGGERVAQLSNNYTIGTITANTANLVVGTSTNLSGEFAAGQFVTFITGTNQTQSTGNVDVAGLIVTPGGGETVTFTTDYSDGDFIRLGDEIRQIVSVTNATHMTLDAALANNVTNNVHYKLDEKFSIHKIGAANSTTLTLTTKPVYASNSTQLMIAKKDVTGVVDTHDSANNKLIVSKSTAANDDFKFVTGDITYRGSVVGSDSQAVARVESIDNKAVNVFKSLINTMEITGTSLTMTGVWTSANGDTVSSFYDMNKTNKISFNNDAIVKSKSNEISGVTLTKSLKVNLNLSASNEDVSPVIDVNPSSLLVSKYDINNDTTDETGKYGLARAKYVSKNMTLTDGMDAEDFRVYLTAYKPVGTDIKVYAKILGPLDGAIFQDQDWTEMSQITASGLYSDSLNPNDNREFEFVLPKTPPSTRIGAVTTYSNTTVNGSGTTFTTDLVEGDLIKIVKSDTEDDYDIVPVASIANNTSLTVSQAITFTETNVDIEKVTQKRAAFKNNRNDFVVRYYDVNNAAHDSIKAVAVKIVLLSDTTYNVPTISDMRAIALSV
jgi:hypothetical protein